MVNHCAFNGLAGSLFTFFFALIFSLFCFICSSVSCFSSVDSVFGRHLGAVEKIQRDLDEIRAKARQTPNGMYYMQKSGHYCFRRILLSPAGSGHTHTRVHITHARTHSHNVTVCTICIRWPFLQMSLIGHSVTLHRIDHMLAEISFFYLSRCMHAEFISRESERKRDEKYTHSRCYENIRATIHFAVATTHCHKKNVRFSYNCSARGFA